MQELDDILTKKEKEYLEAVIMPFRNKVRAVAKHSFRRNRDEYISISLINDIIAFPLFKKDTIYKGMQLNKKYTIEELGLFTE